MNILDQLSSCLIFLLINFCICNADLNKQRTYIDIESPIPCIRRFNLTHQIGCGKLSYGSYDGIVFLVNGLNDFTILKSYSLTKINRQLIILVYPNMFSTIVDFYMSQDRFESKIINGIVLLANKQPDSSFQGYSDDTLNPNQFYSFYSRNQSMVNWNKYGKSYMFQSFDVPFYVITNEKEADAAIQNCYVKFNKPVFQRLPIEMYSTDLLCGMQLGLEMSGAVNTKVCTRRANIAHTVETNNFCDPIGGSNYWSFLSQKPSNDLPITVVSSKIDAFTLYEYFTPGANEPISSIIGLLSLADLLVKHRDEINKQNLLFVFFDNEAFDYGGSSKFTYDLATNNFPSIDVYDQGDGKTSFQLSKQNINTIIELNQLGSVGLNDVNKLYLHRDPLTYGSNKNVSVIIDDLTAKFINYSNGMIDALKNINQPLPPSSIQSFLRSDIPVAGISITDHESIFKNQFYHSVFDTPESLKIIYPDNITEADAYNYTTKLAQRLQVLVTNIAQTLYASSSDKGYLNDKADIELLNKLIYCYYKNSSCDFFRGIISKNQWTSYLKLLDSTLPKQKLSFYTGVGDNPISGKWISFYLLRYLTRNKDLESLNSTECKKDSIQVKDYLRAKNITIRSFNHVNGLCIASSVYATSAVSPAFDKYDSDAILINTDKYPAWTESSWNGKTIQMKLFMYTTSATSILSIVLGSIIFLISIFITIFTKRFLKKCVCVQNSEQSVEFFQ